MRKLLALALSLAMVLSLAACSGNKPTEAPTTAPTAAPTEAPTTTQAPATPAPTEPESTEAPAPQVMSYDEFMAAEKDAEVVIQGTIQLAAYNAEYGNANLFLADKDGAYFVYRMTVDEKDADKMKEGTVLRITGNKTEWSGEVEIAEGATYEILEGEEAYLAEAKDVTDLLGTEELSKFMNRKISISGVLIAPSSTEEGEDEAFLYKWNGSGAQGDDIYFRIRTPQGEYYTVLVESDEFGADTDVYKAAEDLGFWAQVELEGFLYWYEGPQPHISSIKVTQEAPVPMDREAFDKADMDSEVLVDSYVQKVVYNEKEGYTNLFLDGDSGAYYVYRMNVTPEEAEKLTEGAHVWVKGLKSTWSGEIEILNGVCEFFSGTLVSTPENITAQMGHADSLAALMNRRVRIQNAVVAASRDADDKEQPFLYKWNGSGEEGDDLYFTVTIADKEFVMTLESEECPAGTAVYEAVKNLKIGDAIDLEGFLYWYEGPQPHIYLLEESQGGGVMSYQDWMDTPVDSEVEIEGYVQQAAYSETYGNISFFLASPISGSYYVYQMPVTPEEAEQLKEGAHVRVKGFKAEWSGLLEVAEASFELLEGEYFSEAVNINMLMDQEDLLEYLMSSRVSVDRAIVVPSKDAEEKEVPFLYKWNGSGEEGDDIYFNLLVGGLQYTFVVESDEFGADSDVYKAVQALAIGDVIDVEAFLYWYNGPQPHVRSISGEAYAKQSEEALSFGRYLTAELDTEVTVEGFVQLTSSFWEKDGQGMVSLYLHDKAGAYYIYNMPVTQEEAESLVPGTLLRVKGFKTEWSGLTEIGEGASFEILESEEGFIAEPVIANRSFDPDDALDPKVILASPILLKEVVIEPSRTEAGEELPFLYKWNGSGEEGDDIYFSVSYLGKTMTVTVESDEFDAESEVYKAVQALKIGDVVDLTGFMYWYNGPQPHISKVDSAPYKKMEGAMSYREFLAAETDEKVSIDAYVQKAAIVEKDGALLANLFLHDRAGGYYVYGLKLENPEDAQNLTAGTRLLITGHKAEWSGEIEIQDVEKWEAIKPGTDYYLAQPIDMTDRIGDEEAVAAVMNQIFMLSGAEVIPSKDADDKEVPFLYKWNGSGAEGDDIYFKLKIGEAELTVVVETDEYPGDSELYKQAQELQVGDVVDILAFMYFYEGPQPHLAGLKLQENIE